LILAITKIARISAEPMVGTRVLNAKGLVVAPGFIDLHQHGQDAESGRVKAFDGVTTALEMEIGVPDVTSFLAERSGRSLINYGTSASHVAARSSVFGIPLPAGTTGAAKFPLYQILWPNNEGPPPRYA
jgi:imidazolonepropionase-like amidohydrolase